MKSFYYYYLNKTSPHIVKLDSVPTITPVYFTGPFKTLKATKEALVKNLKNQLVDAKGLK